MTKHGFREISRKHSDILNAELVQFEHEKTGARLAAILTDDKNKVFQIGFRTPSDNSTGIAHIMEHSTLCGSRKYPVKEPFVELAKGSINTFLNAMTYPDKTVYPIASTNDKDFRNLQDVYLDAVFYPNIYENPYTLMQEGWHYHLEEKDDPIVYNGVVYNEMKGVFSNPEEILDRKTYSLLFPDTIYGEESGGDPDFIPDLTYDAFIDFHKKFYHPSNSWIYLYGDIDLDEQLSYLDSWLSSYDREEDVSTIPEQKAFEGLREASFYYPVNEESDEEKDFLSLNWVLPAHQSLKENLMSQILSYVLLNSNAAPLKKALNDSGLAKDISYSLSTPLLQPVLSIVLKDTSAKKKDAFVSVVRNTLEDLVANGIAKDELEAAININEFKTLEILGGETGMTPKGLLIGLEMMESWLYEDDAFSRLAYEGVFDAIREQAKEGAFEAFIQSALLDNPHQGLVSLMPKKGLAEEKEEILREKLHTFKESLSEEEINSFIRETQILRERQEAVDSPQALQTIPRLSVSEISRKALSPDWIEKTIDGVPFIEHAEATRGIVYLDFLFDTEYVKAQDIPYLSMINKMIGRIGTKNISFAELNKQIDLYTGGIVSSFETLEDVQGEVVSNFILHAKSTKANVGEALRLLEEITLNPSFTDTAQIKNQIAETRINKEQMVLASGNAVASQRILSQNSDSSRLFEEAAGIQFLEWIRSLEKQFDGDVESYQEYFAKVMREIINRNGLTVSITAQEEDLPEIEQMVLTFVKKIPDAITVKTKHVLPELPKNEGLETAGQVQFNAQGGSFKNDASYTGAMQVLKTILSMDYLWNEVRVKGGAYGASFSMNRNGEMIMSSYRDPNLKKTYDAFEKLPEYVRSLDLTEDEIEKYIIGTISSKEAPLSPFMRAGLANSMYLTGLTAEDRQREREEILDTNNESLRAIAPIIERVLQEKQICTIGAKSTIEADQEKTERFNTVRTIA